MSTTDEIMGSVPKGMVRPRNRGQLRLALEVAVVSGFIRMLEDGYDLAGFRSLDPHLQDGMFMIADQYMKILGGSMLMEGVVTEKNSAYLYLFGNEASDK